MRELQRGAVRRGARGRMATRTAAKGTSSDARRRRRRMPGAGLVVDRTEPLWEALRERGENPMERPGGRQPRSGPGRQAFVRGAARRPGRASR